jgi:hypothetical protein
MPNPTPYIADTSSAIQNAPQYTLQGILPQQTSVQPPPGLALDGLRETGNASTMTTKPSIVQNTSTVSPGDELAVGQTGNPRNGPIGSTYGVVESPRPSANGHEDRSQQAGGQQAPKFAATLSDLMSSFKSVGLKGA